MSSPLRAFLILAEVGADPEVNVFRTLEDVLRAWEGRRDATMSAVLHVGFDRRPARTYSPLLEQHQGRVLLTEAARAALPSSFKSSTHPVALDGDAPIYLALEGWGYSEHDPEPKRTKAPTAFSGWVAKYAALNPQDVQTLLAAGINDEDSYLAIESSVDATIRGTLGRFRFTHLWIGTEDDASAFAAAAPPWLGAQNLANLPLTVRLANVFDNSGLVKVSDLANLTLPEILRLPNFGRTSLRHLMEILHSALKVGPPVDTQIRVSSCGSSLLESLDCALSSCSPREADILRKRMGLSRSPETLAQIGDGFGVSRERIRQIEDRAITRMVRDEIWDNVLSAKLKFLLDGRSFPIPLLGIEALDPWFEGIAAERHAIRYILENVCSSGVRLVLVNGVEYLSFLSQNEWDNLVDEASRLLASAADEQWLRSRCEYVVGSLIDGRGLEFKSLLWEISSLGCHFSGEAEDARLISYGRGAERLVEAVLHDADTPLHYTEIARLASARARREIDERRAHNAAAEVGFLFGPGTYGLVKHVNISVDELEAMADEASEIVFRGPAERQWHTSELLEQINQQGSFDNSVGKHVLDIALKQQGQLTSLGRMIWAAPGGDVNSLRVEVKQLQVAILQQAGRPLTTSELHQRLIAVRGLDELLRLSRADPIIQIESDLWGLNDRDVPLKRESQPHFLEAVYDMLLSRSKPVHVSECSKLLALQLSNRTMISLIQHDERFRTSKNLTIALR